MEVDEIAGQVESDNLPTAIAQQLVARRDSRHYERRLVDALPVSHDILAGGEACLASSGRKQSRALLWRYLVAGRQAAEKWVKER